MTTHEFIKMQLAKPFEERRIPDSLYIRNVTFHEKLFALTTGRTAESAGSCFNNKFMYEHFTRYLGSFHVLYPNIVITEEECLKYLTQEHTHD